MSEKNQDRVFLPDRVSGPYRFMVALLGFSATCGLVGAVWGVLEMLNEASADFDSDIHGVMNSPRPAIVGEAAGNLGQPADFPEGPGSYFAMTGTTADIFQKEAEVQHSFRPLSPIKEMPDTERIIEAGQMLNQAEWQQFRVNNAEEYQALIKRAEAALGDLRENSPNARDSFIIENNAAAFDIDNTDLDAVAQLLQWYHHEFEGPEMRALVKDALPGIKAVNELMRNNLDPSDFREGEIPFFPETVDELMRQVVFAFTDSPLSTGGYAWANKPGDPAVVYAQPPGEISKDDRSLAIIQLAENISHEWTHRGQWASRNGREAVENWESSSEFRFSHACFGLIEHTAAKAVGDRSPIRNEAAVIWRSLKDNGSPNPERQMLIWAFHPGLAEEGVDFEFQVK